MAEYGRCQSDVHHVQISLPAAKIMTHPTTPRKIQTAKSTCFLNSFSPALNRVGRRKKIDRTNKMIGIAAAKKAMIFKSMIYPFVQARMIEESGEKGASGVERSNFLGSDFYGSCQALVIMVGVAGFEPATVLRSTLRNGGDEGRAAREASHARSFSRPTRNASRSYEASAAVPCCVHYRASSSAMSVKSARTFDPGEFRPPTCSMIAGERAR